MASFHETIVSIVPQLTTLLQFKYKTETPFTTHPTTMMVAVSAIMLYYLLYSYTADPLPLNLEGRFAAIAEHLKVWSACVAVLTLPAALYPDPAIPIIYTILGMLSAGQVLYVFRDNLNACRRKIRRFIQNICASADEFFRPQPMLPIRT